MPDLKGGRVVITGGTSGIGRAMAMLFAHRGSLVGFCGSNDKAAAAIVDGIESDGGHAMYVHTDVGDEKQVERFVGAVADIYGGIDILINNAGVGGTGARLPALSTDEWRRILDVNLNGVFYCCKYALPHMIGAGRGAIINISSVLAVATLPGHLPYTTAKSALIGFTKVLAHELGPFNIRVNCVIVGSVDTPMMWRGLTPQERGPAETEVAESIPLKRVGRPEEIADTVAFLASEESSFVTGATLVADGGVLTRSASPR
jgi:NAD(P)-dependent dehydrogenase (short-subunit alcohol dehydrogenase family)